MQQRFVLAAALCWLAFGGNVVRGAEQTWTGAISDSMCGASHAGMRAHGEKITDRECTIACLSYQTPDAPKYVFVSGGKVYPIANQKFSGLGRRSGEQMIVTGELDSSGAMTISKIEPVKKG
jgi:hypothetical protein